MIETYERVERFRPTSGVIGGCLGLSSDHFRRFSKHENNQKIPTANIEKAHVTNISKIIIHGQHKLYFGASPTGCWMILPPQIHSKQSSTVQE